MGCQTCDTVAAASVLSSKLWVALLVVIHLCCGRAIGTIDLHHGISSCKRAGWSCHPCPWGWQGTLWGAQCSRISQWLGSRTQRWEPVPLRSDFGNINFSSIAAQWREKLESAINSAELVKAVKLPPDKAPVCNDYSISWRGCLRWGDSAGAQHRYTCDVLSLGHRSRVMLWAELVLKKKII